MSLRCIACDRNLDTSNTDYCSKCLAAIREADYDTMINKYTLDSENIDDIFAWAKQHKLI